MLKGDNESWLIFQENEACCARKFSVFKDANNVLVWSCLNFIGLLGCVSVSWIRTSIESLIFRISPKNGKRSYDFNSKFRLESYISLNEKAVETQLKVKDILCLNDESVIK